MGTALALVLILVVCIPAFAQGQAPGVTNADATKRPDSYVGKMSPEQKIDYIGGTGFAVRAVPELGLPALEVNPSGHLPATFRKELARQSNAWELLSGSRHGAGAVQGRNICWLPRLRTQQHKAVFRVWLRSVVQHIQIQQSLGCSGGHVGDGAQRPAGTLYRNL